MITAKQALKLTNKPVTNSYQKELLLLDKEIEKSIIAEIRRRNSVTYVSFTCPGISRDFLDNYLGRYRNLGYNVNCIFDFDNKHSFQIKLSWSNN